MPIRKKLMILFISFAIIPTLLFASFSLSSPVKTTEELQIKRLDEIATTSASAFDEIVNIHKAEVSANLNGHLVTHYTSLINTDPASELYTQTYNDGIVNIQTYVNSISNFVDLVMLDTNGTVILGYDESSKGKVLSEMDYYTEIMKTKQAGYVFTSKVHDSLTEPGVYEKKTMDLEKTFHHILK